MATNRRKDTNFFEVVDVNTNNFEDCLVSWNFNSVGFSFNLAAVDENDQVEYSFDGSTVHGILIPQSVRQGVMFDNRSQSKVWLRLKHEDTSNVRVYVEAWRFEA